MGRSDSHPGPGRPSRAPGWRMPPPEWVSRVAPFSLYRRAVVITPADPSRRIVRAFDGPCPQRRRPSLYPARSASTKVVSRPARRSRPRMTLSLCYGPSARRTIRRWSVCHRKLQPVRCLLDRSDCYRVEQSTSRAGLPPAEERRLFTAHWMTHFQLPVTFSASTFSASCHLFSFSSEPAGVDPSGPARRDLNPLSPPFSLATIKTDGCPLQPLSPFVTFCNFRFPSPFYASTAVESARNRDARVTSEYSPHGEGRQYAGYRP
jgi:hypothetical protein